MDVIRDDIDQRLLYKNRQETLGQLLRSLRKDKNLRQIDVARATGFGQSDISKVESGERSLKFVEVDFYAKALGLDVGVLAKQMFETMWAHDDPPLFPARKS